MGQIKTKEDLLKSIDECLDGTYLLEGSNRKNIVDKYAALIKSVLVGLSDDIHLPESSILDFGLITFIDFVTRRNEDEVERRLLLIYEKLYEWREDQTKAMVEKTRNIMSGLDEIKQLNNDAVDDSAEYYGRRKKIIAFRWIVVGLMVIAAAFTLVSFFDESEKWGTVVGSLIGLLDFCFGLGFQIYERSDDVKQKDKAEKAKGELKQKVADVENIIQNATNIININGTISMHAGDGATQIVTLGGSSGGTNGHA